MIGCHFRNRWARFICWLRGHDLMEFHSQKYHSIECVRCDAILLHECVK